MQPTHTDNPPIKARRAINAITQQVNPSAPRPLTTEDDAISLARLERAAWVSGDGYWEHDLSSGLVWYSPRFNQLFGFAADRPAAALPAARTCIRPDWHDPSIEAQAVALHIQTLVAPVTPAQLQRLGADEDIVAESEAEQRGTALALRPNTEVLLVEDNAVNQLVGEEFLRALGLKVRVAGGGEAALAACLALTPDLVLMDLQMPGMDGVLTKPLALDTLRRQLARWLAA